MRKITREAVAALAARKPYRNGNTVVRRSFSDTTEWLLCLYGNTIATIDSAGVYWITDAGWSSNTTKERLNGIPGVSISQKDWVWYLNGKEWNGSWTMVPA